MRKYYISVPSWGSAYCSDKRYVVELADDEQIVGVNHGHQLVIVVAKKGSYHATCGMMPQVVPLDQVFPERFSQEYRPHLNVFCWTPKYNCLYASGEGGKGDVILCKRDSRASDPILARARTVVTLDTESNPGIEEYDWSALPIEDLDPALTSLEDAITGVLLPAMGMAANDE